MVRTMVEGESQNSCGRKPCRSKPSPSPPAGDVNAELRSRPVLYTGVVWIGLLRRFLIPRTCGSALPASLECSPETRPRYNSEAPGPEDEKPIAQSVSRVVLDPSTPAAPSEHLTLLTNKRPEEEDCELRRREKKEKNHSPLAAIVAQVQEAAGQARRLSQDINSLFEDGKTTTSETISTIRKEKSGAYRLGVITASGLVGYLIGVRRGVLTRIVYTATGATAMAAICYPQEAQEYNRHGLSLVRQCIVLGLTLLRDGPQKALGRRDPKDSTERNGVIPKEMSQSQPNNSTSLGKNFGSLGHNHEQIMGKLNSKNPYPAESKQEKKPKKRRQDDTGPPFIPGEPPILTKGSTEFGPTISEVEIKPNSQCEKDLQNGLHGDAPYSPALPKVKHNYNENSEPSKSIPNQNKTIGAKEKSDLHNSLKTQDELKGNKLSEPKNDMYSENYSSYLDYQIPTPEPEMVIEDEEQSSMQEDLSENIHPLNKKLSRYYMKRPAEQIPSLDAGYEDLYSKRE